MRSIRVVLWTGLQALMPECSRIEAQGVEYNLCPEVSEPCINVTQLQECHAHVARGCSIIGMSKSCPVQFTCEDDPVSVQNDGADYSQCPEASGNCITETQVEECHAFADGGCKSIGMAKSCPVQFTCEDDPDAETSIPTPYGTGMGVDGASPNASAGMGGSNGGATRSTSVMLARWLLVTRSMFLTFF